MVGLFWQVWILCAIAFLAGSGVTWLVFVRRPRQGQPLPLPATEIAPWAPERRVERAPRPVPPPEPPSVVEPALANLDTHGTEPSSRHAGSVAAGALDRLGVGRGRSIDGVGVDRADNLGGGPDLARRIPAQGGAPDAVPGVPEQSGPVDGPAPGREGGPR